MTQRWPGGDEPRRASHLPAYGLTVMVKVDVVFLMFW